MKNRSCLHIIIRDKFTSGYINFLKANNFGWNHVFFTFDGSFQLKLTNTENVFIVKDYGTILKQYRSELEKADRIILSSFFDNALRMINMPARYWNKTYIQFWGGDIYRFKQKRKGFINSSKQSIVKFLVTQCIKKSAGSLLMVEKDYDEMKKVFNLNYIPHQIVQVPDDFYEVNHYDFVGITQKENYHGKRRILVGNSATEENRHAEVFDLLKNMITPEVEIVVPLSYGIDEYRESIIQEGKRLFGESFVPILNYMTREEYIGFLSTCDTAIFNNNRQQAMGNIVLLANLGKKIYMREETSMWKFYKDTGFVFHPVSEIKSSSLEELLSMSEEEKVKNFAALKAEEESGIRQWEDFYKQ